MLFGVMMAFLAGYASGDTRAEGVKDGLSLGGIVLVVGVVLTFVLARRRFCQQSTDS
jgi:hypothetical protein